MRTIGLFFFRFFLQNVFSKLSTSGKEKDVLQDRSILWRCLYFCPNLLQMGWWAKGDFVIKNVIRTIEKIITLPTCWFIYVLPFRHCQSDSAQGREFEEFASPRLPQKTQWKIWAWIADYKSRKIRKSADIDVDKFNFADIRRSWSSAVIK
jgi:hypothetical protein